MREQELNSDIANEVLQVLQLMEYDRMLSIHCLLLIVITFLEAVSGDPTLQVVMENVDIKTDDNAFFDPWAVSVAGSGDKLTLKIPVKNELPLTMMMQLVMNLDGNEMVNFEGTLCASLEDELIGKEIIGHGLPKDQFPKRCPIPVGADWEIREWTFPTEKMPPGIPDGPADGVLTIFEEGKAPIVTLKAKGKIMHKVPAFGR
ncbi:uncharacterized protein LOC135165389 [Diachasmimorpha longicaudata]|uniref:uncharacterized protein LOC135165389 n=1 Tax=Diachasmimorpha longicaudata TaxID=58733 RepID=UPI0030B910A1